LPEERLRLQFRQPVFIEARTNFYARPEFNIFPLLVRSDESAESVVGYREVKGAAWLDRSYGKFYASVGYNLQVENPFTYKGPLDPDLSTLIISGPRGERHVSTSATIACTRTKGVFLGANLQFAGGAFGATRAISRCSPRSARTFARVEVTFATRASVGFLYRATTATSSKTISMS